MGLNSVGGKLLAIAGRLVDACCCGPKKQYDCVTTGVDSCGRAIVECQKVTSGGKYTTPNCDGLCPASPPCECDPPCDGCSECVDGKCEPDYGGCEECVNGTVQSACGECEMCINGQCVSCPSGYECVDGVCCSGPSCDPPPPPGTYYCCYDYDDTVSPGSPEEPRDGVTSTYCSNGPCGQMIDGEFVPQAWLTAGGPYGSDAECADNCRKHNCTPDACSNYSCTPDEAGEYLTKEDCNENCADPTGGQCALSPDNFTASGSGAGVQSYFFTVGQAAFTAGREICVTYVSTTRRPIRVQIWGPEMSGDGCTRIADRVTKGDSQWRCDKECPCDCDARSGCKGLPKGFVKWRTKQKNVTTFEVQVRTECDDNQWQIGVTCGKCMELPELEPCPEKECGVCDVFKRPLPHVDPCFTQAYSASCADAPPGFAAPVDYDAPCTCEDLGSQPCSSPNFQVYDIPQIYKDQNCRCVLRQSQCNRENCYFEYDEFGTTVTRADYASMFKTRTFIYAFDNVECVWKKILEAPMTGGPSSFSSSGGPSLASPPDCTPPDCGDSFPAIDCPCLDCENPFP